MGDNKSIIAMIDNLKPEKGNAGCLDPVTAQAFYDDFANMISSEDGTYVKTIMQDDRYKVVYVRDKQDRLLVKIVLIDNDIHSVTNISYDDVKHPMFPLRKYYYLTFVVEDGFISHSLSADDGNTVTEMHTRYDTHKEERKTYGMSYITENGEIKSITVPNLSHT